MADVLTIRLWDDPVLSKVCDPVDETEFGPKLEEFGRQLLATMDFKNGVGLAAPQVGVAKRMFVMHLPEHMDDRDYGVSPKAPIVVCNPVLDLQGGSVYAREGCLSLPNVFEQVSRAEKVVMRYRNPLGQEMAELTFDTQGTGITNARVAQHEFDHLNGIMFFDYKDKRPTYGARMSKQVSKQVVRAWDKEKARYGR
jgi:peptide deformylase